MEFLPARIGPNSKLSIDFIAVQWCHSSKLSDFEGWLKQLKRDYNHRICLTEFNVWIFDPGSLFNPDGSLTSLREFYRGL